MRCEPGLDIAATLLRQLVVDIGVQLVFRDGDCWVGHRRGPCLVLINVVAACLGSGRRALCFALSPPQYLSLAISPAIISPAGAPGARHQGKLSPGRARGRGGTSRCRSARPECRRPRGSSGLPASPTAAPRVAPPPAWPARGRCRGLPPR